jgi:hypothetical protein
LNIVKNHHWIVPTVFALLLGVQLGSWAGLPQGTQTLVRFRRAYLVSNITFPGGVGFYPQQEDDEAQAKLQAALVPVVKPQNRLPATALQDAQEKAFLNQQHLEAVTQAMEAHQGNALKRRFSNGLFNVLNVVEFGDASIAKRMETHPKTLRFIDHYDNGEDYLYLPAIGIPVPIRLQSKNTFIH